MATLYGDKVAALEQFLVGATKSELKVMNYRETMTSKDAEASAEEVGNEKIGFDKFNTFTLVLRSKVPK